MAINFGDNFNIAGPLPIDERYYNGLVPYTGTSEVLSSISVGERYLGLTVLVQSGSTYIEYWFKDDINTLVEKKYASEQVVGDFITGATNLGYFSGTTGVQVVQALTSSGAYNGNYFSIYNYYYRDNAGVIRIGKAAYEEPFRRAYVATILTLEKSWVWDVSSQGWRFIDGDVRDLVGQTATLGVDYGPVYYTVDEWSAGFYNSGSTASITVSGDLTTGNTITIANPIYSNKSDQELHLRTIINDTPNFLRITNDDYYIRFSGATSALIGQNVGAGTFDIFTGKTGCTMYFRTLTPSGDTSISQRADGSLVIFSSSDGSANALTGATNLSGGTGEIIEGITDRNLQVRTLVGTGDVTITTTGDTVIIDSQAGGTYNLDSPAVCTVGGISAGTVLTGKTSFELWEELLVPTQNPTLTPPSVSTTLSVSGTFEVGCTISSLDVCSSFNAGCINPQYTATCDKRSCGVIGYCFESTGGQCDGYYVDGVTLHVETIPTYTISAGTQTWCTSACHCAGVQPYDSKGGTFGSPLSTGFTTVSQVSLTGIYPWFWGTSVSAPTINQTLLNNYTCNCLASSTGTITVDNFNITTEYFWFAIPASGPTKTVWQGLNNPSNNGTIPDSLMATPQVISVNSPDGCGWTCNYEFYVSNYATSINYGMQFCN